jgi:hypothetical protein
MPQDRDSGDRARKWGYSMAQKVANHLGASLIRPKRSNEAMWQNRRVLIKSAHYGVPEIGATASTVDRVEAIIAALQDRDGLYTLYEVLPDWFRKEMVSSRSPKASHVMMVRCARVREAGKVLGRIKES